MQQDLLKVPPSFAAVPDPKDKAHTVKMACSVSDDAKKLNLSAVTVAHGLFSGSFDEAALTKMKAGADVGSWSQFFQDIQKAYTSNTITVTVDAQQCVASIKTGAGTASFTLAKSGDQNGTVRLLDQLWRFYELRNEKTPDAILDGLKKRDDDLKRKVADLEDQKVSLQSIITSSEAEEKALRERSATLTVELNELTEERKKEAAAAGLDAPADDEDGPLDPDFSTAVSRIALGDKDCREYDQELLQLIKSKFGGYDAEDKIAEEADQPWMKVVKPLTTSAFEENLKALPECEKSIILRVMEKIDSWDYNVWTIQDFSDKGALFVTGYALFCRHDIFRKFNVDEEVAINFLSQVEAGYHPNPYHNSMHGADVLHIVHFILNPGGLKEVGRLTDVDAFAGLIAGMIHDYDHPGLNNNFHVKVQSCLAILYNDRSILENHHCAEVFEMMKIPKFNILSGCSDEHRRDIRETVIEMVLSTDMGLHAKIFGTWKRRIGQDHDLHKKKDDQRLALSMVIKMADISNCGRPEDLYLRWASKLAEEFFLQGDNERNRGDTVSPFMDRYAPSMAKSQIAFMNYIVIPMFESIAEYLPDMHFSVDHCESNKNYWASNDDSM